MKINIQSIGFSASQQLLDFTEGRLGKLERFADDMTGAEVYLKIENGQEDRKVAEINLKVRGGELHASKQANSFEEAIDESTEALRRQLVKRKGKERP